MNETSRKKDLVDFLYVCLWLVIREVEGEKESVGECGLVEFAAFQHELVIVYHMGGEERMRRGFAG